MAIAAVNGATASSAAAVASLALAATSLTATNDIVIAVCILDTTKSVSSITDTAGNTYTQQAAVNNSTSVRVELWAKHSAAGNASNVVTVNFSGTTACAIASEQYSGVDALGNTGTATGTNQYPRAQALTQNAQDFSVVAVAIAGGSTDTIAAAVVNLRQSKVDAGGGTIPEVAIADNTTLGSAICPAEVKSNVATRPWAAAAVILRTSATANVIHSYEGAWPIMELPTFDGTVSNVTLHGVHMAFFEDAPSTGSTVTEGQAFPPMNLSQ